jgi:hypothetical protein
MAQHPERGPGPGDQIARERRRRVLLDPPRREREPAGYLGEHGVRIEAVAVIRRGGTFRVLTETTP